MARALLSSQLAEATEAITLYTTRRPMKTPIALTAALFTTLLPAIAFAGGPPGDSPEPSSAMLLLLGAAPLVLFAGYQLLTRRREAARVIAPRA